MNCSRRGVLVAAAVGALVPQWWLRPGAVVAAGDTGLPLFSLRGITSFWGDQFAGTGSTGYPSAMLLERGLMRVINLIGGSPSTGQRLWFTVVIAVAAASVAWMAAAFVHHSTAGAAAGIAAVINPFHIHSLPNMLPLVCLACMALVVGMCARWWRGWRVPPVIGVLVGLWSAELARNPPLLVLFGAVASMSVAAVLVAGRQRRTVVAALAWFAAASLFWVVPVALHFLGGTAGLEVVAATGSNWEWTQRHSDPLAVMTFTAAWVWGDPDVLTATATLSGGVWVWLRLALPAMVVGSLVIARHRRVVRWLAVALVALVVVSTGVNAPFGPLNRLLANTVPGFWLFRQPASKFGVPLLLCAALALAIGADALLDRRDSPPVRRGAPVAMLLVIAALAFSHPLLTGSVIPGDRRYLPSSQVMIPASLIEGGRMLDAAPGYGATLVLPLSEYYQRGTVWGYYGVDDVVSRVSSRPALYVLPGGYYEPAGAAPELMQTAEAALRVGDRRALTGAMDALGTSLLAVRLDPTPAYGRDRRFVDGAELDAAATAMGLPQIGATDVMRVYSVPSASRFSASAAVWSVVAPVGHDRDEALAAAAAVAGGAVLLDDGGTPAAAWAPWPGEVVADVDLPSVAGVATAVIQGPLVWMAAQTDRGLEVRLASGSRVAGTDVVSARTVPVASVAVEGSAEVAALIVRDELVPIDGKTAFQANGGESLAVLVAQRPEPINLDGIVADRCVGSGGHSVPVATPASSGVQLVATSDSPCVEVGVDLPVPPEAGRVWRVRARFSTSHAGAARLCLWVPSIGRCAPGTEMHLTAASGTVDLLTDTRYVDLAGARLVLSAAHDGLAPDEVRVRWSDVSVQPLAELAAPLVLSRPSVPWTAVEVGPGTSFTVLNPVDDLLGTIDNQVGDCNDYDDRPARLSVVITDGSDTEGSDGDTAEVTLRADRHSACVSLPIERPQAMGSVELRFQYRSSNARAARYAVVDVVSGDTLATAALPAADEWATIETTMELPPDLSSQPGRARLYLYADGAGPGEPAEPVAAEYRAIRLSPRPPITLVVLAGATAAAGDRSAITDDGPRRATLAAGLDATTIVMRQAFAPGWSLHGLPEGATARHVRIDGWANGWIVEGLAGRAADLEVDYRWERVVAAAVWSVVPVVLSAAVVVLVPLGRRRRPRKSV